MRRIHVYLALALLALALCSLTYSVSGSETATEGRAQFKVPKLFDFELFKSLFKRSYRSLVEELSRKRIYLARAFRVFISAIGYKYRRNPTYLAINERSDWTNQERQRSFMKLPGSQQVVPGVSPMVDMEQIEQKLGEISEQPRSGPGFEEVANELLLGRSRRRKRDTSTGLRDLSLDQLIGAPPGSELFVNERVESNNPNYEPPELPSAASAVSVPLTAAPVGELASTVLAGAQYLKATLQEQAEQFSKASSETGASSSDKAVDQVYVDHRKDNCLFRPRDQGDCGSCYAFAAVALYEWHYCKATGEKIAFSEQYIVDCGKEATNGELDGCDGGFFQHMTTFVRLFGMELRADYPYRGKVDTCPYEPGTPISARGYIRLYDGGFEEFEPEELADRLTQSPILMGIHVDTDTFSDYGGGVDEPLYCRSEQGGRDGVHAVLFVGHGREDGQEYWLIRNSYGPTWGLSGYYKMNKKSKQCLRYNDRFHELVNFSVPRTNHPRDTSDEVKKRRKEYEERDSKKKRRH